MIFEKDYCVSQKPNGKIDDITKSNRCIEINNDSRDLEGLFNEYAGYYYKAAHFIASYIIEDSDSLLSERNAYFLPMAFLYRHSIELLLKSLVLREGIGNTNFYNGHDLVLLLNELLLINQDLENEDYIKWLKEYLINLNKIDNQSDCFRYPFYVYEGTVFLFFTEQTCIDTVMFANKFEAAYEILNMWYIFEKPNFAMDWKKYNSDFIDKGNDFFYQAVIGNYYPN